MFLEPHKRPDTGIHAKRNDEQKYRRVGSVIKIKGLKVFKYNLLTKEVSEVIIVTEAGVTLKGEPVIRNKASFDEKHLYTQALNLENAQRKFKKVLSKLLTLQIRNNE